MLRYLVKHPGRLVSKAELLQAVWPEVVVGEVLGEDSRVPQVVGTVRRCG